MLMIAGCNALEDTRSDLLDSEPVEITPASELTSPATPLLATYDDQYKLVFPLLVNKLGTQVGALPGLGWYTNAVLQNTTGLVTWVKLTAYTSDGNASGSVTRQIGPHENLVFRADNPGAPGTVGIPLVAAGNFEGSMTVEADHRVAAIAQLQNLPITATLGHPQGKAAGAYAGSSLPGSGLETGQELVYPTMKCGYAGKSTTLFVQNAGPDRGTARLDLRTSAGTLHQVWITLERDQSRAIGCSVFPISACSGAACLGSIRLVPDPANARFSAVAIEHATPPSPLAAADVVMAHEFQRVSSSGDAHHAACPVFKNQLQLPMPGSQHATSGIAITNASSTTASIEVTLCGSDSPPNAASHRCYLQSFQAAPWATVVASPWAGTAGDFPASGLGSAEIHSTQPIVAQVNESSSASHSGQRCASTSDDELFVPSFKSGHPSPTSPYAANTKVTLQNLGAQAATLTAELRCRDGNTYTVYRPVAPRATVELGPGTVPPGLYCAATIRSPGAQLVGTVQESTEGLSIPARDSLIYEPIRFD